MPWLSTHLWGQLICNFKSRWRAAKGCWALSSPGIWLFTLLNLSVGATGDRGRAESKGRQRDGSLSQAEVIGGGLQRNHHKMLWNPWCSGQVWPGLQLICRLQLKQKKFTGGSRPLGIHYKLVHLGSHFSVHLAFLITVEKISEGLCADESRRLQ